jgi:hypothetical protein
MGSLLVPRLWLGAPMNARYRALDGLASLINRSGISGGEFAETLAS